MTDHKPILCLDFDGVIHSYTSGWQGADVVSDPPVDGAIEFLRTALGAFRVAIYSSRSGQQGGIEAMKAWLKSHATAYYDDFYSAPLANERAALMVERIEWPTTKPPAMLTIDDRAITFTGQWPDMEDLLTFQPWNKRDAGAAKPQGGIPTTRAIEVILARLKFDRETTRILKYQLEMERQAALAKET
jgi:hypothetical protein